MTIAWDVWPAGAREELAALARVLVGSAGYVTPAVHAQLVGWAGSRLLAGRPIQEAQRLTDIVLDDCGFRRGESTTKVTRGATSRETAASAVPTALPGAQAGMAWGTVKWFNAAKGFGFVTPDDGTADVFIQFGAIQATGYGSLRAGQRVTYHVAHGPKGPIVDQVHPL